ncbi:hypothetical protein B0T25DRAFT_46218 [Lasiosphaeria hispida]|uniref:Uncharacterized protein n=1 Tax=Lasiosphaeria hispida TaxID=260671 RepID=A0AAJ0MKF3_9PEZI|nr:hypothetical protein B0T25DRAFT_46218 [Lasiosphaeria hispida]
MGLGPARGLVGDERGTAQFFLVSLGFRLPRLAAGRPPGLTLHGLGVAENSQSTSRTRHSVARLANPKQRAPRLPWPACLRGARLGYRSSPCDSWVLGLEKGTNASVLPPSRRGRIYACMFAALPVMVSEWVTPLPKEAPASIVEVIHNLVKPGAWQWKAKWVSLNF